MIKTAKRNIRSSVFLLLIAAAAVGSFGALSSGGRAAVQGNDKQSRATRSETGSTNDQSSRATKKNRTCKQVCDDTYYTCQKSAQPFPKIKYRGRVGQSRSATLRVSGFGAGRLGSTIN